MDAAFFNEVANHPDVRPGLGAGLDPVDLTPAIENPANLAIEGHEGGWLLHPVLPGVYEIHSMFRPEGRGKVFFVGAREMLRYVFTTSDALEIVTKCPDDNGPARMAAATVGFRERFRREDAWAPGVGVSYRVFSIDDWFIRDAECLAAGRAFHDALEAAKMQAGSLIPVHADDEAHDRAVGAAVLMARGGNMAKGVGFYCRWATFAGYASITAVSQNVVDVGDGLVEIGNDGIRVLKCRLLQP